MSKVPERFYKTKALGIKAVDVRVGDQFLIEEVREQKWDDGRESLGAIVEINGEDRTINLNKTTVQMLISTFGEDYNDWIDKEIFVAGIKPTRLGQSIIWAPVQAEKKTPVSKKKKTAYDELKDKGEEVKG